MEIDLRQVPEGERLSRALDAFGNLAGREVLTLLCAEDPAGLADSLKSVHGPACDCQRLRWSTPGAEWLLHVKHSY
jgi:uncharacterized protein (DUF2249 family)